ncbi:MAG: hypothetical protein JWN30_2305 [Bacilli bacterium]|nr:hypothetical protein [Bacilli bacterium]
MTDSHPRSQMEMMVAWGDCDAAGISYYARAFDWFTNGRMQFLDFYEFPYMETFHSKGISLVCLTADCQYKKMLHPQEKITVRTFLTSLTRTRMTHTYQIFKKDGSLAAEGKTSHAYVDHEGIPFNLKKRFPQLWQKLTGRWILFKDEG